MHKVRENYKKTVNPPFQIKSFAEPWPRRSVFAGTSRWEPCSPLEMTPVHCRVSSPTPTLGTPLEPAQLRQQRPGSYFATDTCVYLCLEPGSTPQADCAQGRTINESPRFEWQAIISQSAHADKTHHSFHQQFFIYYLAVQWTLANWKGQVIWQLSELLLTEEARLSGSSVNSCSLKRPSYLAVQWTLAHCRGQVNPAWVRGKNVQINLSPKMAQAHFCQTSGQWEERDVFLS